MGAFHFLIVGEVNHALNSLTAPTLALDFSQCPRVKTRGYHKAAPTELVTFIFKIRFLRPFGALGVLIEKGKLFLCVLCTLCGEIKKLFRFHIADEAIQATIIFTAPALATGWASFTQRG